MSSSEYNHNYYLENKEALREKRRAYYLANRSALLEKAKLAYTPITRVQKETKVCGLCQKERPATEFYPCKLRGLRSRCIPCEKQLYRTKAHAH